ncbi:hypothetical protein GJU41_21335 [Bacillus idriensis]|uniref:Uncharacterized protein n=1 Tax=Metabacillus idriensis TaxID=324768 RepID=A0A6I2MDT5_9BACI|nr:TnsD family Tn7-like transposition protein [Metabacillus idriensis]MRX56495.1 hypothetical protein [Metabacillus idriensis]
MQHAYFPKLYNDELLYSWFARYHELTCNFNNKQTQRDLFNSNSSLAVPDLPTNLDYFYGTIKHFNGSSLTTLIHEHTLFRYYTAFTSDAVRKIVFEAMKTRKYPRLIHNITGIMASSIKEWTYFRYCPRCVEENMSLSGEIYWKCSQQLPGVYVCIKHKAFLLDSTVRFRNQRRNEFRAAKYTTFSKLEKIQDYSLKTNDFFYILARESNDLIENNYYFSLEQVKSLYKDLIMENGYATIFGTINQQSLGGEFIHYYGEEFLKAVQSMVYPENQNCWLKEITRKHRKVFHPIRHLLLLHFFGIKANSISSTKKREVYAPFGKSPFVCLNKASDHYKKSVVKNVEVKMCKETKRPLGIFQCDCGFVYSRKGPDPHKYNQHEIGQVRKFGDVWIEKLKLCIFTEKMTFAETARVLNCDVGTVKKYINLDDNQKAAPKKLDDIERKKQEWQFLMNSNVELSITEIRKENPALYAYLYRNDRAWLMSKSPKKSYKRQIRNRINWEYRDAEIVGLINEAIKSLLKNNKPVYISISRIGKEISKLALLQKHLDKLPDTKQLLSEIIETRDEFQVRRVQWACNQIIDKGDKLIEWKIRRIAGLNDKTSKKVNQAILNQINQQNTY